MEGLFSSFSRRMEANEEEDLRVIIDDVLYEFHCPERETSPDVLIIFFHGMMWGDSSKAYANTWKSVDGSLWPKTWLAEKFPNASILSIAYDSSLVQSHNTGRLDLHQIAENLIQILKENIVGAESKENCPTIMVGKDLGCRVIQEVCLKADEKKMSEFLTNLKGFFFYSPFQLEIPIVFKGCDGKLVEDLKQKMSKPFGKFLELKADKRWTVRVLHPANSPPRGKRIIIIPEDCSRWGSNEFYSASEDFYTITTPQSKKSQNYLYLKQFISFYQTVRTGSRHQSSGIISLARTKSTCSSTMKNAVLFEKAGSGKSTFYNMLLDCERRQTVLFFGKTGYGKSTLCNMLVPETEFETGADIGLVGKQIAVKSNDKWIVIDTVQLGDVTADSTHDAVNKFRSFVSGIEVDHICFVMRKGELTLSEKLYWYVFRAIFGAHEKHLRLIFTSADKSWLHVNKRDIEELFGTICPMIAVDFPPKAEDYYQERQLGSKRKRHLALLREFFNDHHWEGERAMIGQ